MHVARARSRATPQTRAAIQSTTGYRRSCFESSSCTLLTCACGAFPRRCTRAQVRPGLLRPHVHAAAATSRIRASASVVSCMCASSIQAVGGRVLLGARHHGHGRVGYRRHRARHDAHDGRPGGTLTGRWRLGRWRARRRRMQSIGAQDGALELHVTRGIHLLLVPDGSVELGARLRGGEGGGGGRARLQRRGN